MPLPSPRCAGETKRSAGTAAAVSADRGSSRPKGGPHGPAAPLGPRRAGSADPAADRPRRPAFVGDARQTPRDECAASASRGPRFGVPLVTLTVASSTDPRRRLLPTVLVGRLAAGP